MDDRSQNVKKSIPISSTCELTMNRDGVMEAEPEEYRLSVLSAVEDTQLTTRGILLRRSPAIDITGFSAPPGHNIGRLHFLT